MSNKLSQEKSLYLRQHAKNPVHWYPWGEEPFVRAIQEDKPVIVSIGYAACHWCHVMEKESFENKEIAEYMNQYFICIKVDREEHPEIDHLYMNAVQAMTGHGGWPLNVFVTPEKIPFYGGTYFPPRPMPGRVSWIQLLERIQQLWEQNRTQIHQQVQQITGYLTEIEKTEVTKEKVIQPDRATCQEIAQKMLRQADTEYGGFGDAPKFPETMALRYLLEHAQLYENTSAKQHALHSLKAMMYGGINDQIGGGFARYATDRAWLVPHFEKMLYDNALLVIALTDAWKQTEDPEFAETVINTLQFLDKEMKAANGLYYSAIDADSEGVEGKYYTWQHSEWAEIMRHEPEWVTRYFGVRREGNWEHTNILHRALSTKKIQEETGLTANAIHVQLASIRQRLFTVRSKRERPLTDDKCLLSWNALMNTALVHAAQLPGGENLTKQAEKHMDIILSVFEKNNTLLRVWNEDVVRITAGLEDYAWLIQALLQLGAVTADEKRIMKAVELCEFVLQQFLKEDKIGFYLTARERKDIPFRQSDVHDGAMPSANALMTHNLFLLGNLMARQSWIEMGKKILQTKQESIMRYPLAYSYWAMLTQRWVQGYKIAVVVGSDAEIKAMDLRKKAGPHAWVVTSKKEIFEIPLLKGKKISNETIIFVCTEDSCMPAVSEVQAALSLL